LKITIAMTGSPTVPCQTIVISDSIITTFLMTYVTNLCILKGNFLVGCVEP